MTSNSGVTKPEVAFLVVNYLKQEKYSETLNAFLKECPFVENVKTPNEKKAKALHLILDEYAELKFKDAQRIKFLSSFGKESNAINDALKTLFTLLDDYTSSRNTYVEKFRSKEILSETALDKSTSSLSDISRLSGSKKKVKKEPKPHQNIKKEPRVVHEPSPILEEPSYVEDPGQVINETFIEEMIRNPALSQKIADEINQRVSFTQYPVNEVIVSENAHCGLNWDKEEVDGIVDTLMNDNSFLSMMSNSNSQHRVKRRQGERSGDSTPVKRRKSSSPPKVRSRRASPIKLDEFSNNDWDLLEYETSPRSRNSSPSKGQDSQFLGFTNLSE